MRRQRIPVWYLIIPIAALAVGLWAGGVFKTSPSTDRAGASPTQAEGAAGPTMPVATVDASISQTTNPAPATPAPISPAPPTTPPATPASSAYTGTVNLSGKVASDIPGTLVAPPATITSVIDVNSKPRDVYAIELQAGDTLKIVTTWLMEIDVLNPGSESFDSGSIVQVCYGGCWSKNFSFVAAVSGTYYLGMVTVPNMNGQNGLKYTMSLSIAHG